MYILAMVICEGTEEACECPTNPILNLRTGNPFTKFPLYHFVIQYILHCHVSTLIIVAINSFSLESHTLHSHLPLELVLLREVALIVHKSTRHSRSVASTLTGFLIQLYLGIPSLIVVKFFLVIIVNSISFIVI